MCWLGDPCGLGALRGAAGGGMLGLDVADGEAVANRGSGTWLGAGDARYAGIANFCSLGA